MSDVNANIGVNIDSSQALAQLKALQRQLSEFNLSIAKSNEAAALAQKSLQKNLVNSINSIGAFSAELRTVNTTAESFTKALENNKLSMREYFRYAGASTKSFGQNFKSELDTISKVAEERVKTLQTQYIKLGRDANGAMKAIAVRPLALDMDSLATKTQLAAQKQAIFNQILKQGSTNLLNFGKNTQWAGRQLMVGFTLPLMAFGTAASKAFKDLETEVIKFKKVYGDLGTTSQQTDKALADIRKLADGYTKYGVEVSKTVALASQAAAAGFQNADLLAQTDAASKLAVLGQIEQQQALETTISLQNAFKISSQDLATTIDFLNAVENQTVTSLDDITTAIPKVAPVIQQLGGDVKDLAFFLTAMKEGGVNAAEGANALKSGLASLINPSKKATDMLGNMGININNIVTKNQGNLKATVIEFAKALDALDPLSRARAIETMFGKFQFARISTLLDNVTKSGTQASRVLTLAGESAANLANLTSKELGITAESALVRFQAALAKLKASLAPVGEVFMKSFTPILDFISNILDKFNNLSDGTKKFIAITVGVVGGLGPILLMTFGLLANGIANIIKLFATLRTGYQRLTGQSQNLGEQTQYLTSEQLDAAAAAHSLEQSHARLTQQFTVEATAVNELRYAYQKALAAGAAFALNNPAMMKAPKLPKFAGGSEGVIVRGPGTGTSDSILARVSNGEAIIPAASVARNPDVVHGLVAGNLPGFAFGDEEVGATGKRGRKKEGTWRSVKVPGGYDASHFGTKQSLTGQQLLNMVQGDLSSVGNKIREMVGSVTDGLTRSFTVFDNSVVAQLREINQDMFYKGKANVKKVRENLTSDKYAQVRDIELQNLLTEPQNGKAAVMSIEEFGTVNQKITTEIKKRFDGLSDAADMTSDELDKLLRESYDAVAATDERVAIATEKMREVTTVTDPRTSSRIPVTSDSYTKKKPRYRRAFEKIVGVGKSPYPEMTNFGITESMAAQAGRTKAEAAALYKAMSDEAKLALFELRNDIVKFGERFVVEVNTLGTQIGTSAVEAVAKGAQTHSNSRATKETGKFIDGGLAEGMIANEAVVEAAGVRVGKAAVDSVNTSVVKESAKKPRVSYRPQGPAPIGTLPTAGSIMLPIIAALTDEELAKDKVAQEKGKRKEGLVSGKGMMAGMGLMVGSMAISALPEFTGKALLQSSVNLASMGAMFGPWGAAAGAALGLVTAGLTSILDKQRKLREMSKAVFESSTSVAQFFGNAVVDVDNKLSNYSVVIKKTSQKTDELTASVKTTTAQLKTFKELVDSLNAEDPLKKIVDGLAEETDPARVRKIAEAFVTTQVALGQLKADQAQTTLDLILASSNHLAMVGSVFITIKSQAEAVTKAINNTAGDSEKLGLVLTQVAAGLRNASSYQELQAVLDAVASSGYNAANGLMAMYAAYMSVGNTTAANMVDVLSRVQGATVATFMAVQTALSKGIDVTVGTGTTAEDIYKQIEAGYKKLGASAFAVNSQISEQDKKQIASNESKIKGLQKRKDELDKLLKKEQSLSDEMKRQYEYTQKQQDLEKKIIDANLHGNYVEAALLGQQKIADSAQFAEDTRIGKITAQRDELDARIADLQKNTSEIQANTTATDNLTSAITNFNPGVFTAEGTAGQNTYVAPKEKEVGPGSAVPGGDAFGKSLYEVFKNPETKEFVQVKTPSALAATVFKSLVDAGYVFHRYAPKGISPDKATTYKNINDVPVVYPETPGETILERAIRNGAAGTIKKANGGYIKHFGPGGGVFGPGSATSDSIPAMLSNGEYVLSAKAVEAAGGPSVVDGLHQALRAATGGHISGGKLSASHMSSSKINKEFERKLIESGVRKLPSRVTKALIDKILSSQNKKGSLAGYQQQALELMSDRSDDFKLKHLNDATARLMPNWNLPYDLATQARMMITSGRNKDQVRGALGISSNVYVPGKYADGGYIQHFGTGGMPSPFSIGMSKVGNFFKGVYKKAVKPTVNNPVTRFAKNELFGIDDLQTAWKKGKAGDDFGAMKAGAASAAELGLTVAGGPIFEMGLRGLKFAAKPLTKIGINKKTFPFIKNMISSIGSKAFSGVRSGINKTGKFASSVGSKLGNLSVKNKFESMYASGYDAATSPSWEKPVFKAQEMIKKAENSIAGQKFLEKFAILSSKGLKADEIFANPEFEALRSAAGWDKNYLNNLWSAAGRTIDLPEKEIKAFYKGQIAQIKKGEKLAGRYLKSPMSYLSRMRQAGSKASPMGQSIVSKADSFFNKFGFGAIKNKVSSFIGKQTEALGFSSAVGALRKSTLHSDPKSIAAVEKYGYGLNNPNSSLAPNATTSATAMLAEYDKNVAFQKLLEAYVWKVRNGVDAVDAIKSDEIIALGEKAGYAPEYLNNLHASAGHLLYKNVDPYTVMKEFKNRFAVLNRGKAGAEAYLSSPLTLFSRVRDKIAAGSEAQAGGFSRFSNSPLLSHILEGNVPFVRPIKNLLQTYISRTRSDKTTLGESLLHPRDVPIDNGRSFGPGTYFAKTMEKSGQLFSYFGNNIYKNKLSPLAFLKVAFSKGYITQKTLEKEGLKFGDPGPALSGLSGITWDHPFIQHLIKRGYIGFKHHDAYTNWMVGTKGFNLKPMQLVKELTDGTQELVKFPSQFEEITKKALDVGKTTVGLPVHEMISKIYDAYQVAQQTSIGKNIPKFHNWNGVVPGQYGEELNAVLKSGTEGVYQNDYIRGLKKDAIGNSSTSNSNAVYNNHIVINGTDLNKKELADELMSRLDRLQKSNNKSNKVMM